MDSESEVPAVRTEPVRYTRARPESQARRHLSKSGGPLADPVTQVQHIPFRHTRSRSFAHTLRRSAVLRECRLLS